MGIRKIAPRPAAHDVLYLLDDWLRHLYLHDHVHDPDGDGTLQRPLQHERSLRAI